MAERAADSKLKYVLFALASLLSIPILFLACDRSGWEMLVVAPIAGLIILAAVASLVIIFRRKQADAFTMFIAFGMIALSVFSLRINMGVVTDAAELSYWGTIITTEKLEFFHSQFFDILLAITIISFFPGLAYFIRRVMAKGSLGKREGVSFLSYVTLIIASHFYVVATEGEAYLAQRSLNQQIRARKDTFRDRYASYIELDEVRDGDCSNTSFALDAVLGEKKSEYMFSCLANVLFDGEIYRLPAEHKNISHRNSPEANPNFISDQLILIKGDESVASDQPHLKYSEGDIIAVTAEIPPHSHFVLDAPGNKTHAGGLVVD